MWRVVPGGVSDIIEGSGANKTTYSVLDVPSPSTLNGSYVSDAAHILSPTALRYINRNLTIIDRMTPFRVVLLITDRLPKDTWARQKFGVNLLRHWFVPTRTFERSTLLMLSMEGYVEVVVGPRARMVMNDAVAHHFAQKATELLRLPEQHGGSTVNMRTMRKEPTLNHVNNSGHAGSAPPEGWRVPKPRMEETAQKLVC